MTLEESYEILENYYQNIYQPAENAGLRFRLGPLHRHHRPQLLQVDPVDLPADVQEGAGLQGFHARQLVHQLQDRPGQ